MRTAGLAALLLMSQPTWAANSAYPDVSDFSGPQSDGTRLLQDSIVIGAPAGKVWAALVDPQTIKEWSAPMAAVELKQDGYIEEGFTKSAKLGSADNIRHHIIAYLPGRVLVLRNENAPSGLPGGERFKDVIQIVELEAIDPQHTRVRVSHTGYGADPDFDKLYAFFSVHNPEFLEGLKHALENTQTAQAATGESQSAK